MLQCRLQVIWSKAHGQQLAKRFDLIRSQALPPLMSIPTVHEDRHIQGAELPDKLPAHPAWTCGWRYVSRHGEGNELRLPVGNRFADCAALGASSYGIARVLDIDACDDAIGRSKKCRANTEFGVGALSSVNYL